MHLSVSDNDKVLRADFISPNDMGLFFVPGYKLKKNNLVRKLLTMNPFCFKLVKEG